MFILAGIFLMYLSYKSIKHITYVKKQYELVEAEIVDIEKPEVITEDVGEIITIEYIFNNELVRLKKEVKQGSVLGSKIFYYVKEGEPIIEKNKVSYAGPIVLIFIGLMCIVVQIFGEPVYY